MCSTIIKLELILLATNPDFFIPLTIRPTVIINNLIKIR